MQHVSGFRALSQARGDGRTLSSEPEPPPAHGSYTNTEAQRNGRSVSTNHAKGSARRSRAGAARHQTVTLRIEPAADLEKRGPAPVAVPSAAYRIDSSPW